MKTGRKLCAILLILGVVCNAKAQFWKKLQKKVEEKVEQKIIDKTSDKAAETTDSALEEVLNPGIFDGDSIPSGGMMADTGDVPENYSFDWQYQLEMKTRQSGESMLMDYYLKKDATYWGAKMNQKNMPVFMVYDMKNELMVMFMEQNGNKQMMATKMGGLVGGIEEGSENSMSDYTFKEIGEKKILGYSCKGYIAENDKYHITLYITFEAPVAFSDMFSNNKKLPKGFNEKWFHQNGKNGLLMEMEMIDKNNDRNNLLMKCTDLKKHSFQISKTTYAKMGN